MTANDIKYYVSYLNKLVDQYNNIYHHCVSKIPNNADYSALTEKVGTNHKASNLKLMIELELLSTKIFLVKVTLKIGREKYL